MKQRTTDTQTVILNTAIKLLRTKGFVATPMDTIAKAANVAKGTLYYHFDSKEGIVDAIVERDAMVVHTELARIETDPSLGFIDKLTVFMSTMTELIVASYSKLKSIKYIDILDKTLQAMVEYCAPPFSRILEQGNASGQCRVKYPLEYAEIVLAFTQALVTPKAGSENSIRRINALVHFSASTLGMNPTIVARIFKPLITFSESLPARIRKD